MGVAWLRLLTVTGGADHWMAMPHAAKELKTLKDCGSGQCQAEPSEAPGNAGRGVRDLRVHGQTHSGRWCVLSIPENCEDDPKWFS